MALPVEVDWRKVPGVLTPVKNQGNCGSCWAFATTETIESEYALINKVNAPVLSPQNVVSCTPNPQQCGGTGGCGGATAELGLSYVSSKGIYLNSQWPYSATNGVCTPPSGNPYAICQNYTQLPVNSYSALQAAVVNRPISVSVAANTWSSYKTGILNCSLSTQTINHAVQLVGYGMEGPIPYWIVRNSWGVTWGEAGYIRLLRHADGSMNWCWPDNAPQDGSGCPGGPSTITVCGNCGIWYDSCYTASASAYT